MVYDYTQSTHTMHSDIVCLVYWIHLKFKYLTIKIYNSNCLYAYLVSRKYFKRNFKAFQCKGPRHFIYRGSHSVSVSNIKRILYFNYWQWLLPLVSSKRCHLSNAVYKAYSICVILIFIFIALKFANISFLHEYQA